MYYKKWIAVINPDGLYYVRKTYIMESEKRWVTIDGRHVNIGGDDDSGSGGGSSGGSLRDSSSGNIKITDETIDKVPKADIFGDEEKNERYQQANKDLLKEAQKQPAGTEVSIIYDENMKPIVVRDEKGNVVKEYGYNVGKMGKVKIENYDKPYHAFHNHPSGETFSPDDILGMTNHSNMQSISAIGNNGNVYCMLKGTKANSSGYRRYLINRCQQKRFLGKFSYFDVSSKSFDSSSLSDTERSKLKVQLQSFCESCVKGGIFYGFSYKRQ